MNLVVSPEDAAALKAAAGGEQGRATIRITAEVSPGLELDAEVLARTRLTLTEGPTPTVTASCDLADWMTSPAEQPRKETSC